MPFLQCKPLDLPSHSIKHYPYSSPLLFQICPIVYCKIKETTYHFFQKIQCLIKSVSPNPAFAIFAFLVFVI